MIGPPGSGKSKYCWGVKGYLEGRLEGSAAVERLRRQVAVVNLDPGNEQVPYESAIDVRELVSVEGAMEAHSLGPNGSLLYCMEFLEKNVEWLEERLLALPAGAYLLFDCPGQVELYTHHQSLRCILSRIAKAMDLRLAAVHLVDSHYCTDPSLFIAASLTALTTMLQLELPHVNVLTKIDLLKLYGQLPFKLEFFTDMLDLPALLERFQDSPLFPARFKALNAAMCDLLGDFSLVAYLPLNIFDPISFSALTRQIDKANGFISIPSSASSASSSLAPDSGSLFSYDHASLIQDLFIDSD